MTDVGTSAAPVQLECLDVGKAFGGTVALDGVSVRFQTGSVHALVGENGAGKSTLVKILAGAQRPDRGALRAADREVTFASPRGAIDEGIVLVAQELALVPALTVAENVLLGVEPHRAGFVDRRELTRRYHELATATGFDIPGEILVRALPLAQQQQVEILRALARDARVLLLDEPTAALSRTEVEKLHDVVRTLAQAGRTVVLVSHFLREVLDLADTVTVLRDGRVVRTGPTSGESEATLIAGMLGRSVGQTYPSRRPLPKGAPIVLRATDLVAPGVAGVSLDVRAGEIVGLAGLVGAGRTELARAIYGAVPLHAGRVEIDGQPGPASPRTATQMGLALIPESRKAEGLMLQRSVAENVSVTALGRFSRLGVVRRAMERAEVGTVLEACSVRGEPGQPAGTLSGGNQQKLLFARSRLGRPRLLIADEPTRGVDVGAKRAIYELLVDFAAQGVAILLISSETEEVLGLAHRVVVMRAGRISAEFDGADATEEAILAAAFTDARPAA